VNLADFDFELPPDRIAQEPATPRDASRLLVLDRDDGSLVHRGFRDLPEELRADDLLVLNDTRVLPARLVGTKGSGGRVEMLLVEEVSGPPDSPRWRCLLGASKKPGMGGVIHFPGGLAAEVVEREGETWIVRLSHPSGDPLAAVVATGSMPLPPYIRREPADARAADDRERYQTVFARRLGAVAAPTAGLHFTPELLARIRERGVAVAWVTLHVGLGTFLPVRVERIEDHRMHEEAYDVPEASAQAIAAARARGGRIVAVGTTVLRTLETAAAADGVVRAGRGRSALFITPGFRFRAVDAMVTNFHLPRSTLLMLVAAFAGRERVLSAYAEAVRAGYRFYSYGDAMFVRSA
jgi:S-adenosylmethionine:tRNA ribosyltransferase-isomerase